MWTLFSHYKCRFLFHSFSRFMLIFREIRLTANQHIGKGSSKDLEKMRMRLAEANQRLQELLATGRGQLPSISGTISALSSLLSCCLLILISGSLLSMVSFIIFAWEINYNMFTYVKYGTAFKNLHEVSTRFICSSLGKKLVKCCIDLSCLLSIL